MVDKKEVYEYRAKWPVYGLSWSVRPDKPYRLALGSFIEEYTNQIQIIQLNESTGEFEAKCTFENSYPATKVMFIPDQKGCCDDLVATSGDYLKLWEITDSGAKSRAVLNNNKSEDICSPLTAFDWNERDLNLVGTASIDTTCTIWDIQAGMPKTQLIAHDSEVFDIVFAPEHELFASASSDGSVRMFDLRSLEHSTIIFESPDMVPIVRLAWNKRDPNFLAAATIESTAVHVLDIRNPSVPLAILDGHSHSVNTLSWAPHSSCHLVTGADDSQALIWELPPKPEPIQSDAILAYQAPSAINSLAWSQLHTDWIAISFDNAIQTLRV